MRAGIRLACDVGSVRVGLARSDPQGLLAVPLPAVRADDPDAVLAAIAEYEPIEIIVGLPISLDASEGPAARRARDWAEALSERTVVPVRLCDERLTTVEAQRGLHAAGRTTRTSRSVIDSAAAVILLQADLDAERARGERG
jgi:putative Holliday junction resolvase